MFKVEEDKTVFHLFKTEPHCSSYQIWDIEYSFFKDCYTKGITVVMLAHSAHFHGIGEFGQKNLPCWILKRGDWWRRGGDVTRDAQIRELSCQSDATGSGRRQ